MKYEVRLHIPTTMWALLEIEADSPEQAIQQALHDARNGQVSFEYTGFDVDDVVAVDVEASIPEISQAQWMRIVLAIKGKLKSPVVAGRDEESVSWRAHLRTIKQTIVNGEYPILDSRDWTEIYYCLDDDSELQTIIGTDGQNMVASNG